MSDSGPEHDASSKSMVSASPSLPRSDAVSLGAVVVLEKHYKADLALLERFQSVSAELVRISLLGIGALGFLLKGALDGKPIPSPLRDALLALLIGVGALLFALSASAGLLHRYFSADGFYYHIKSARVRKRDGEGSQADVDVSNMRNRRYVRSGNCLLASSILLALGGLSLACGLIRLLWLLVWPACEGVI